MPAAKDITDEELLRLLEAEDPSGFRIPMSLGEPHAELDKGAVAHASHICKMVVTPQIPEV